MKALCSELFTLQIKVLQDSFKSDIEDKSLGRFYEDNKRIENRATVSKCRYLMETMRDHGFRNIEEIYNTYTKLSDWVGLQSEINRGMNPNFCISDPINSLI